MDAGLEVEWFVADIVDRIRPQYFIDRGTYRVDRWIADRFGGAHPVSEGVAADADGRFRAFRGGAFNPSYFDEISEEEAERRAPGISTAFCV